MRPAGSLGFYPQMEHRGCMSKLPPLWTALLPKECVLLADILSLTSLTLTAIVNTRSRLLFTHIPKAARVYGHSQLSLSGWALTTRAVIKDLTWPVEWCLFRLKYRQKLKTHALISGILPYPPWGPERRGRMGKLPNNCRYLDTITDNKLSWASMEHSAIPVFENSSK